MNNKEGFTLIEAIIALALIGIITVGFVSALGNYFLFFDKTKEISKDVFATQEDIEVIIDMIKDGVRNEEILGNKLKLRIDGRDVELTLQKTDPIWAGLKKGEPGVQVKYFEIEESYNNKEYITLVSDYKPEVLDQIEIESIDIKVNKASSRVPYAYDTEGYSITGNFKNDDKYKYDHLLNIVEWYISDEKFNMPIPDNDKLKSDLIEDIPEMIYYYPSFPRDYILVKNETINNFGSHERTLLDLEEYRGRHIVFTATPGAKSGRIGIQGISDSVFISGLPITKNLAVHLDASFIDPYIKINNIREISQDGRSVERWNDISSTYSSNRFSRTATQSNTNKRPQLFKTEIGEPFIGQFVRFQNLNNMDQELGLTVQNTRYMFVAIRSNMEVEERYKNPTIFLKNGSNYNIQNFTIPKIQQGQEDIEIEDNQWLILKQPMSVNSNSFQIGGPNVDIAEIAIYSSKPSSQDEKAIEEYFLTKYRTNVLVDNGIVEIIDEEENQD